MSRLHPHQRGFHAVGTEVRGGRRFVLWAAPSELREVHALLAELREAVGRLDAPAEQRATVLNSLNHFENGLGSRLTTRKR